MNRTKIEWTNYTWSPIVGCYGPSGSKEHPNCCSYCYAKAIARRFGKTDAERNFEPTFYLERIKEPYKLKKPSKIFVCSMSDMFGDWVPGYWVTEILWVILENPQHIFQILTKNPKGLIHDFWPFPKNLWVGITADTRKHYEEFYPLLFTSTPRTKFISFEPLLEDMPHPLDLRRINWVIIGSKTGPKPLIPYPAMVENIIDQAIEYNIPVFLKDNLGNVRLAMQDKYNREFREFPCAENR